MLKSVFWLFALMAPAAPLFCAAATPEVFDPTVTRPWQLVRTFIEVQQQEDTAPVKLAVTYAVPIPTSGVLEDLPVLMEYLPYRKDDSMYPLRYNVFDYFASRGFIYAYVDIRGTGGSDGTRIAYEYTDVEIEDGIQIIQQLGEMEWDLGDGKVVQSNGNVALWGQSWSAFNAFIIAGKKARDSRLDCLKTIVPIHGAVNLYEGDIHYMDGIFHEDEYILSVDHENAMPSYGFDGAGSVDAFKIDQDFINNRWNAYPWSFFYLGQQLKDDFWKKRTEFFNGPFSRENPDDFTLPVFVIGSLLDGYRDAPLKIYEKLKAKHVPVKFAMGPSNHTLPDECYPGPLWEWRSEVAKWLWYWLVDDSDPSLISQNEFAVYVRDAGDDARSVPGYWRNDVWPTVQSPTTYYLTKDNKMVKSLPPKTTSAEQRLDYKPTVGTEMGVWWGEGGLPDMATLDADSLVYDLDITTDQELVGFPSVSLRVAATSTEELDELLAHWHVRLEDVAPNGTVSHVTGASINGAYRNAGQSPSYLKSGQFYTVKFDLHFTTWTFRQGHKLRISVTNALYRMMWPSPHKMYTKLKVSTSDTFVKLPLQDAKAPPVSAHPYTKANNPVYTEPADGWYFIDGGYPRVYQITTEGTRKTVTWKSDYYSNCSGWIVSVELDHQFVLDDTDPTHCVWTGYAKQIYEYVGVTDYNLWAGGSVFKPGPRVPSPSRTFTIETNLRIDSTVDTFTAHLDRKLTPSDGDPITYSTAHTFDRLFQ